MKIETDLSELKTDDKLLKLENKFTELVYLKLGKTKKQSCDEIEQNIANITAKKRKKAAPALSPPTISTKKTDFNISSSFLIQGIPEGPKKTINENLVPTIEAVNSILKSVEVDTEITSMNFLRKFTKKRTKPRTLLVTVRNEYEMKLIWTKCLEKREELARENIYLLHALTKDKVE